MIGDAQHVVVASLLTVMLVFLFLADAVSAGFSERLIKCKVCERSVEHVWNKGVELRRHCKHAGRGVERDERCDFDGIHSHAIEQMAWGVCDALPVTYKAIHDSEFDLILHEDPQHSSELANALKAACVKFLHDEHGAENIGMQVHRHLEAGQSTLRIMPVLKRDFCSKPCAKEDLPTPLRPEHLHDEEL